MDFANANTNTNANIPKSVIKNVPRMLKYIKIKFQECEYQKKKNKAIIRSCICQCEYSLHVYLVRIFLILMYSNNT